MSEFLSWFEAGDSGEVIVDKGVNLCLTLNIQTERVCRGFLSFNIVSFYLHFFVEIKIWSQDILMHIYGTRSGAGKPLTKEEICGFLVFPTCWVDNPSYEWSLDFSFLGPKPIPDTPQLPPVSPFLHKNRSYNWLRDV